MPKNPINYQNTVIYKIVCKNPAITDTYTGSTTLFNKRKYYHKSMCHNPKHKPYKCYVYQFIRDNGGWSNWDMIQIESYPCNNQQERALRERHWFEINKSTLNKCVPSRTRAEWNESNPEYSALWRKAHPDYMKEYRNKKQLAAAASAKGYHTD